MIAVPSASPRQVLEQAARADPQLRPVGRVVELRARDRAAAVDRVEVERRRPRVRRRRRLGRHAQRRGRVEGDVVVDELAEERRPRGVGRVVRVVRAQAGSVINSTGPLLSSSFASRARPARRGRASASLTASSPGRTAAGRKDPPEGRRARRDRPASRRRRTRRERTAAGDDDRTCTGTRPLEESTPAVAISSGPWPGIPNGLGSSTRRRSSTPAAASSSRSSRARSRSPPRRAAATSRATRRSRWPSRRPRTPRCPRTTSSARSPRAPAPAPTRRPSRTSLYEGYGPGGVALLIEALTDNRNRTGADVRHVLTKHGGNLGEPGSVAYLFEKKGVIVVDAERYSEDDLMPAIDAGAQDIARRRRRLRGHHRARRPQRRARGARGGRDRAAESAEVTQLPTTRVAARRGPRRRS